MHSEQTCKKNKNKQKKTTHQPESLLIKPNFLISNCTFQNQKKGAATSPEARVTGSSLEMG